MTTDLEEIDRAHRAAVKQGDQTYLDPATGFTVFTEIAHLKRGVCCGAQCRHCPYGWANVRSGTRRTPKVKSGDKETARRMMHKLRYENDDPVTANEAATNQTPQPPGKGGRGGGRTTSKNVPYTRVGDKGTSELLTGERRPKNDAVFEALGTVDELCSVVGVAHAESMEETYGDLPEYLLEIMSRLFDVGSHVANPMEEDEKKTSYDGVGGGFDPSHIDNLEDWIDAFTEDLPELTSFILPTGSKLAAQLHVARCVCRRAERRVVGLVDQRVCDPNAMRYLNRLSDFFFTAARWANLKGNRQEIQYRLPFQGATQRGRLHTSFNETTDRKR